MDTTDIDLEITELRRFLAVAEEKSFQRAARRLGMSQPPLSRSIARLEEKLRAKLFRRTTREVAITEAGEVLREQARFVLDAVSAAARRTMRAGARTRDLVVAVKAGGGATLLRRQVVKAFEQAHPEVRVRVRIGGWGEQTAMLLDGRADVAFVRGPLTAPGIDAEPLFTEPRLVALAASHPLAGRRTLRRRDLAKDPVPRHPGADPVLAAYRAGVDIGSMGLEHVPMGPVVTDSAQLLDTVALGQGIAFVPRSAAEEFARKDIRYVPVSDLSPSTVYVGWAETCRSREVLWFVRVAVATSSSLGRRAADLA